MNRSHRSHNKCQTIYLFASGWSLLYAAAGFQTLECAGIIGKKFKKGKG